METKRAKVIMLPTENKTRLIDNHGSLRYFKVNPIGITKDTKPQHLYFITDDEIKEGDWYIVTNDNYNKGRNSIAQADKEHLKLIKDNPEYICKKIVSSTDESLGLAKPSQAFIKKYCELGGIDEVNVEYEDWFIDDEDGNEYKREDRNNSTYHYAKTKWSEPKVDSHNTITIHPIKDSWSRKEVVEIGAKAWYEGKKRTHLRMHGKYLSFEEWKKVTDFYKWIEENLN